MWAKLGVFILVGMMVLPSGGIGSVQAHPHGVYESAPCPDGFPTEAQCGFLTVPEHHADPDSPMTIQIAVAVFPSFSPEPEPDPVIYLSGGPGDSTLKYVAQSGTIFPALDMLRQERDIILFDQRGTAFSKPNLKCTQEVVDNVLGEIGKGTVAADNAILGAMQACHDRLVADGVNLSAFNSIESAGDIEALRLALGYDQINLFGASYGTTLALYITHYYPDAIRSLTLEAPAPPEFPITGTAGLSFGRALNAVFEACSADTACQSAYPNLEADFYTLIEEYNAHPVHLTINTPTGEKVEFAVDGYILINGAHLLLYYHQYIPFLPMLVGLLHDGNTAFMKQFIEYWIETDPLFGGEFYAFRCSADAPLNTPEQIEADLQALHPVLREVAWRNTRQTYAICAIWDVPTLPLEEIPARVQSDIPTLILTGEFDPITPPQWGAILTETMTHSYLFEIPTAGHGTTTPAMSCPMIILANFMADIAHSPDASCIEEIPQLQFMIAPS